MYYLDSNTCIYFLNGRSEKIKEQILSTPPNEIVIPSIVKAELIFGAYKSASVDKTLEKLEKFLEPFEVIPFSDLMGYEYAAIRKDLSQTGELIGPNDLLIAAIVRFNEGTLITNNVKEFSRVKDLKIENWYL